jgi:hypothetical protein
MRGPPAAAERRLRDGFPVRHHRGHLSFGPRLSLATPLFEFVVIWHNTGNVVPRKLVVHAPILPAGRKQAIACKGGKRRTFAGQRGPRRLRFPEATTGKCRSTALVNRVPRGKALPQRTRPMSRRTPSADQIEWDGCRRRTSTLTSADAAPLSDSLSRGNMNPDNEPDCCCFPAQRVRRGLTVVNLGRELPTCPHPARTAAKQQAPVGLANQDGHSRTTRDLNTV